MRKSFLCLLHFLIGLLKSDSICGHNMLNRLRRSQTGAIYGLGHPLQSISILVCYFLPRVPPAYD